MATTTRPDSVSTSMGDRTSSVLVRFKPVPGVTTEQYDETLRRLEALGNWPPEGLAYHVAFRSEGNLRVSEIWDSRKELDAFGERLMPVLKDVGIELSGEPEMLEIHNIIKR
jgi:hypothetical protein